MTNKTKKKGIYCIETERWYGRKDRSSVEPILRLLEQVNKVRYLRKDVATCAELEYFLKQYTMTSFHSHSILYLGFHGWGVKKGDPWMTLTEGEDIFLKWIGEHLHDSLKGRVVYFGACGIMKAENALQSFRATTEAGAVLGYEKEVDWVESAAFDLLVLSYLQEVDFTHSNSLEGLNNKIKKRAGVLYNQLGFKILY